MSSGTDPSAQLLREEEGLALVAPLLEECVLLLAVEGAVQIEPAAPRPDRDRLDRLQEAGGDSLATVVAVHDQILEPTDRTALPQAVVERQRSEADDPGIDLGAQIPLARRGQAVLEGIVQGSFLGFGAGPVLTEKIDDCWKISSRATADGRQQALRFGRHPMRRRENRCGSFERQAKF